MAFFADTILDYFNSGAGPFSVPYGRVDLNGNGSDDPGEPALGPISLDAVLGDDPGPGLNFVSLPTGSYVTVGFNSGFIINGPGEDIFIRETGGAGDRANVFVSTLTNPTPADFIFLGVAQDNVTTRLDLSAIGFSPLEAIRAVKIVGLDNNGTAPGFDVVNVQVLQVLTAGGSRILTGTDQKDIINGGNGADVLIGNGGNDLIVGGLGQDTLSGGGGRDNLNGGSGNDKLNGGTDTDRIVCGAGRDQVALVTGFGADLVTDFGDRLDKLDLPGRLRFQDLTLTQRGNNTVVSFRTDVLVTLAGINVSQITAADILL